MIRVIGTAHVSSKSVDEVKRAIAKLRPDIVAVELCKGRYDRLVNKGQKVTPGIITQVLTSGNSSPLLATLILSFIQNKIGDNLGISAGKEIICAVKTAEKNKIKIALIDQDIALTMRKLLSSMTRTEKIKFVISVLQAFGGMDDVTAKDVEKMKEGETLSALISEFQKTFPGMHKVLVEERNEYMARNLYTLQLLNPKSKILAFVGAGHKKEIMRLLKQMRATKYKINIETKMNENGIKQQTIIVPKEKKKLILSPKLFLLALPLVLYYTGGILTFASIILGISVLFAGVFKFSLKGIFLSFINSILYPLSDIINLNKNVMSNEIRYNKIEENMIERTGKEKDILHFLTNPVMRLLLFDVMKNKIWLFGYTAAFVLSLAVK